MAKTVAHPVPHPRQEKPYPDFPLFWHVRGYWCKKRGGRQINYGPDWKDALKRLNHDEDAIAEGKPVARVLSYTLADAVNLYLDRQEGRRVGGDITDRHFARCRKILEDAVRFAGGSLKLSVLAGDDAAKHFVRLRAHLAKLGPSRATTAIGTVRACLDHASRSRIAPPIAYGDEFNKPSAKDRRKAVQAKRAKDGEPSFSAAEIAALIADNAKRPQLLAYILLGINCGLGSGDIAEMPRSMVDLDNAVIRFPRPKNALPRVCPLWPETVAALKAIPVRDSPLMFLTKSGLPVCRTNIHRDDKGVKDFSRTDTVQLAFRRSLRRCSIVRKGAGFYSLRSALRTLAIGSGADPSAVEIILGHSHGNPMDAHYIRGDILPKLRQVSEFVRAQVIPNSLLAHGAVAVAAKEAPAASRRRAASSTGRTRSPKR